MLVFVALFAAHGQGQSEKCRGGLSDAKIAGEDQAIQQAISKDPKLWHLPFLLALVLLRLFVFMLLLLVFPH